MLDNQLIALILQVINAGKSTAGISAVFVKQNFQPTQQGANTSPTAYLYKLFDEVVGSPLRSDVWDNDEGEIVHTESQQYATHFQLSALATQDPSNVNSLTASDILNLCRYTLQSDVALQMFLQNSVGIQRILQVRNTPFQDDSQRWEYQPTLDFIITHKQVITSTTPLLQATEVDIYEV